MMKLQARDVCIGGNLVMLMKGIGSATLFPKPRAFSEFWFKRVRFHIVASLSNYFDAQLRTRGLFFLRSVFLALVKALD